jgi:hypothetical protein
VKIADRKQEQIKATMQTEQLWNTQKLLLCFLLLGFLTCDSKRPEVTRVNISRHTSPTVDSLHLRWRMTFGGKIARKTVCLRLLACSGADFRCLFGQFGTGASRPIKWCVAINNYFEGDFYGEQSNSFV